MKIFIEQFIECKEHNLKNLLTEVNNILLKSVGNILTRAEMDRLYLTLCATFKEYTIIPHSVIDRGIIISNNSASINVDFSEELSIYLNPLKEPERILNKGQK